MDEDEDWQCDNFSPGYLYIFRTRNNITIITVFSEHIMMYLEFNRELGTNTTLSVCQSCSNSGLRRTSPNRLVKASERNSYIVFKKTPEQGHVISEFQVT